MVLTSDYKNINFFELVSLKQDKVINSGLQTVVIVERTRRLWNETTHEGQFYLSSLEADAVKIVSNPPTLGD